MRRTKINIKVGTDAHRLVVGLLKLEIEPKTIAKAAGCSAHQIGAIRAHITMGTY